MFILNRSILYFAFILTFLITPRIHCDQADIIIFSFDRPLQLDALLQSVKLFVSEKAQIHLLYRTNDSEMEEAYNTCIADHVNLRLTIHKQGSEPRIDFKPLLMNILDSCKQEYVFFMVDDDIIIGNINIAECIDALEQTDCYGFYFLLGSNITESYTAKLRNQVPPYRAISNSIISWSFKEGIGEWHYPNCIDRTLYRKKTVIEAFNSFHFTSPNTLEAMWAHMSCGDGSLLKNGLCFKTSKIINIPLNIVQEDWRSQHLGISNKECLAYYQAGKRIDISKYCATIPVAPHIELPLFLKS